MTTTFADIELTEDTDYYFEHENYSWKEGDVVSLPRHTARKFVHNWDKAKWTDTEKYEVRDEEYDEVAARVRNRDEGEPKGEKPKDLPEMKLEDMSYNQMQEYAKEKGIKANQSKEDLYEALEEKLYE